MNSNTDVAMAQIIGFNYGRWNRNDIIGLIKTMSLTRKEWETLKKDYTIDVDLNQEEIKEVDDYFKQV